VKLESTELAHTIVDVMDDRQAGDIVMLDIRPISLITDFFVIGTGESRRQLSALVDSIVDAVRDGGAGKPLGIEGAADSGWILLDYGAIVVHLFGPEEREYYQLEKFWDEAALVVRIQ
jgi:ribosome-associated protein